MRSFSPAVALAMLAAAAMAGGPTCHAEPFWPGPAFLSAATWEMEMAAPLPGASLESLGFGASAGLAMEGVEPARGWGAGLRLAYRWFGQADDSVLSIAAATAGMSYRMPLAGPVSLRPGLDAGVYRSFAADGGYWGLEVAARLELDLLLGGREYLSVTPTARWTPGPGSPFALGLIVGMRSEKPWLAPMPKPECALYDVPALYSPDGDGVDDGFLARLRFGNARYIAAWSISIADSKGDAFVSRSGTGRPPSVFSWDGRSDDGRLVDPASDYRMSVATVDVIGSRAEASAPFTVDILVIKVGDKYKIRVPSILFPSNSADLSGGGTDWLVQANGAVLQRLITLFARFPDYSILVEGHANSVRWSEQGGFLEEQASSLVPLSLSRATAVLDALVMMGIARDRISANGIGGLEPIVPFYDAKNSWKNRRVEFILLKRD